MQKRYSWYGIVAIALFSLIFTLFGFVQTIRFTTGSPVSQTATAPGTADKPVKEGNIINVFIIGDSIAMGIGDEKLQGIGGYLKDLMKTQTPRDIVVDNAGIDGLKTAELLQSIKSGRMDNALKSADFIVISIGGNDLREIQRLTDVSREAAYQEKKAAYLAGLKETTQKIRALNKNSVLIFIGLYDPTGQDNANENAKFVSEWNYQTQLLVAADQKAIFIPTYDLFKLNLDRFMAADKLHPNSTGYQMISYLISKDIENMLGQL
ncbi:MAG: GDSL-type esterase/lipase family protein [Syntrophomonas sp.]